MFLYLFYLFYSSFLPLISNIILLCIFLGATGASLGIRDFFVACLIRVFEWGSTLDLPPREDEQEEEEEGEVVEEEDEKHPEDPASIGCGGCVHDISSPGGTAEETRPRLRKCPSSSNNLRIIEREHSELIETKLAGQDRRAYPGSISLLVDDTLDFIAAGIESIIEDQVTSRFSAEQLPSWNLLTRTKYSFQHISPKLTLLWLAGFLVRYLILVPIRICLFVVGLTSLVVSATLVGYVPDKRLKRWLMKHAMLTANRVFVRSFSGIIRFHDRQNRARDCGICVANHTSPFDVMVLSTDNCYAMIGQRQGGILGFLQKTMSKTESHIWFERSEAKDRNAVLNRMRDHLADPEKLPIIIFPEGTCINNTSVMMFKKGSFEIGSVIYPIAIKYDARLGDAFWNSQETSYGEYLWRMMTSWAIIADVWYMPAMARMEGEDSISFARRVKRAIAKKGGLVDLEWDGMLKREKVSTKLIEVQQKLYYQRLSRAEFLAEKERAEQDQTLDILQNMSDELRRTSEDNVEEDEGVMMKPVGVSQEHHAKEERVTS